MPAFFWLGVFIIGGWILLQILLSNDEVIWSWLSGPGYQPKTTWPTYRDDKDSKEDHITEYPPPRPKPERVLRNFGSHANPLSLEPGFICAGLFLQIDARTWQCEKCQLVHFQNPDPTDEVQGTEAHT